MYAEAMTYFMRHGEDIYEDSKEGGPLTPKGIQQVRAAVEKIKALLIANLTSKTGEENSGGEAKKRITILHGPTRRVVESVQVVQEGLQEAGYSVQTNVNEVLGYDVDGNIGRERAREFISTEVKDPAKTIILGHKMGLMVVLKASWSNRWSKQNTAPFDPPTNDIFEHGEVKYGK